MRTSPLRSSRKFAQNNVLKGAKFIADSSVLATVVALYNMAGLASLVPTEKGVGLCMGRAANRSRPSPASKLRITFCASECRTGSCQTNSSTGARRCSRCIGSGRCMRMTSVRRCPPQPWCSSTAAPSPARCCSTCETPPRAVAISISACRKRSRGRESIPSPRTCSATADRRASTRASTIPATRASGRVRPMAPAHPPRGATTPSTSASTRSISKGNGIRRCCGSIRSAGKGVPTRATSALHAPTSGYATSTTSSTTPSIKTTRLMAPTSRSSWWATRSAGSTSGGRCTRTPPLYEASRSNEHLVAREEVINKVSRVVFVNSLFGGPTEEADPFTPPTFPLTVNGRPGSDALWRPVGISAGVCPGRVIPGTQAQVWAQTMEQENVGRERGGDDPTRPTGLNRAQTFSGYGWNPKPEVAGQLSKSALVIQGLNDGILPTGLLPGQAGPGTGRAIYDALYKALALPPEEMPKKVLVEVECASHALVWEGSDTWAGPHATLKAALIEWIKRGKFKGKDSGSFIVNESGVVVNESGVVVNESGVASATS